MHMKLFTKAGAKKEMIAGRIPVQHASLVWHVLLENIHNIPQWLQYMYIYEYVCICIHMWVYIYVYI